MSFRSIAPLWASPSLLSGAWLLLILTACQPADTNGQTQTPATLSATYPDPAILAQLMEQTRAYAPAADSSLFPFVYQGPGRSLIFEAYTVRFALTHPEELVPRLNNQVAWVDPERYNENNGLFATYVRNGRELRMENPYIQVQYINRNLPYCSTLDSLYLWLDNNFLANPEAQVLREALEIPINLGRTALTKEYKTANPGARVVKYLAYAYIPYSEDYTIGMVLTTTDASDFDNTKQAFYQLAESFTPIPQ